MDDLLAQFLIEGPEQIQEASDALLRLERATGDRPMLDRAFRAFHTLKGSVGLFNLPTLGAALHAAEDLLGDMRAGRQAVDPASVTHLLGVLSDCDRTLAALARGEAPVAETSAPLEAGAATRFAIRYAPPAGAYFNGDDPIAVVAGVPGLERLVLSLGSDDDQGQPYDPFACRLRIDAVAHADEAAVRTALRFVIDQVTLTPVALETPEKVVAVEIAAAPVEDRIRSLRVDVERIDALTGLAAELAAARTGLAHVAAQAPDAGSVASLAEVLIAHAATLDRLTNRIHDSVNALRMAPVGPVLRRFPRVVREMAEGVGKDVEVVVEDEGVEADKAVVEGLAEPLTHLLRNAVDHGLETPQQRRAVGKPPRGCIVVGAWAEGGRLRIRVQDDGRGFDSAAIRRTAAARALLDDARLEALGDADALDLVFLPGFSTTDRVTRLSGRGVGMDAVRAAVQALGGDVRLSGAPGCGAMVELSLPLAVSLTKVLVVGEGADRYGLPLESVLETRRLAAGEALPIRQGHAFTWRDRTAPLLPLSDLVGGEGRVAEGDQLVVVVRSGGIPVGIAVERIDDRLDVAMRPLGGLLAGIPGVSGTAVLGDGQVLMILDTERLAR